MESKKLLFVMRICYFCLLTGIALSMFPTSAKGLQPIKVHKQFVAVSPPDERGMVAVVGRGGAVEHIDPATVQLIRLSDNHKIPVLLNEDGSFEAAISAKAGEKVRVLARSREGRRSYGTFTVPAGTLPSPTKQRLRNEINVTDKTTDQTQPVNSISLSIFEPVVSDTIGLHQKPLKAPKNETIELAVIITVVNTNNGRIVAARRIAGPACVPSEQKGCLTAAVRNIMNKCTNVVKAELKHRVGSSKKKSPENRLSTNTATQKAKAKDKSLPEIKLPTRSEENK
ncbi:MAG: hypothetical protein KAT56_07125 [Sedimentisphaerales bacterium]|nr:hypothetical protein [Sedimentisphaerales bacterium]